MKNTLIIKKNNDFVNILKKGKWFSGDLITIYVQKNSNLDGNLNRIGIAVSKKYSKSSVKRNRIKRLIKEVYRLNEDKIKKGYSIVFLWKNSVNYEDVCFKNILLDTKKCLKKADLINNSKEESNA